MTHTTNFNLSQWSKSDRIQMADFNADNQKIDAALALRNVCFYTASYTGDGSTAKTFTFPHKPMAVFIMRSDASTVSLGIRGASRGLALDIVNGRNTYLTWADRSVTLACGSNDLGQAGNYANVTYTLLALLDAGN